MGVERNRSTWERLGKDDPLWAIMPYPAEKSANWDLDEFMATGVADIELVVKHLAEHSLRLHGRVLDFGCGVGRLTNAIAEQPHVTSVVGVDIASSMVERARQYNRHPDRVEFHAYDGTLLPFADGEFDCAVSLVVIQHAPPLAQLRYLVELNRVVAPGGVLVVQVVTEPRLPDPLPAEALRARFEPFAVPACLRPGESARLTVRLHNDSSAVWPSGVRLRLGNHWRRGDEMVVRDDGRADLPSDVPPGGTVELPLTVTAPTDPGTYQLEFDMVQELVTWWSEAGNPTHRVGVDVVGEPVPVPEERPDDVTRGVEMHAVPDHLVRDIVHHCGNQVISRVEDHYSDGFWDSYTYVIRIGG